MAQTGAAHLGTHTHYAITIFGYRKAGMSEEEYHAYISETHAGHLKALLRREGVVSYTMQHNTRAVNEPLLRMVYGPHLPRANIDDCDAVIQIVFRDIEDYLRVRQDPHFVAVVAPDHKNFADAGRTRFAAGWFEVHVGGGKC
ncbi:O-methyltransferase phnC [Physcia stellaris]|nr:O-methyltransferase phnC [Physcia stellaris]